MKHVLTNSICLPLLDDFGVQISIFVYSFI